MHCIFRDTVVVCWLWVMQARENCATPILSNLKKKERKKKVMHACLSLFLSIPFCDTHTYLWQTARLNGLKVKNVCKILQPKCKTTMTFRLFLSKGPSTKNEFLHSNALLSHCFYALKEHILHVLKCHSKITALRFEV